MKKIILQLSAIRQCPGGYTCNLLANGKKVAFVGPGIFEWTNHAKSMEVLEWFANYKQIKLPDPKPTKIDENWQPDIPDHKQNRMEQLVESKLIEWIWLYVKACQLEKACKTSLISVDTTGQLFNWDINLADFRSKPHIKKLVESHGSAVLNGRSAVEILAVLESAKLAVK